MKRAIVANILVLLGTVGATAQIAHPLQTPLKYPTDTWEDIAGLKYLTKEEVEYMYYKQQKNYTEKIPIYEQKAKDALAKGDVKGLEAAVKNLTWNKNAHDNWEFFWDGLSDFISKPRANQPLVKMVNEQYDVDNFLLQNAWTKMFEECRTKTMMDILIKFEYGERHKTLTWWEMWGDENYVWVWLLWNSATNQTETRITKMYETYLNGGGNGILHPLFVWDSYLVGSGQVHLITDWQKVNKRLEGYMKEQEDGNVVLVTGGLGYIGSHTVTELVAKENMKVVIVDNMDNSKKTSMERVKYITGKPENIAFQEADLKNGTQLEEVVFKQYAGRIKSVIHFAALKAVGESVAKPLEYYYNNVAATIQLLGLMKKYNVKTFVFSSSATVYGDNPLSDENAKIQPINPYGQTKAMNEQVMKDYAAASPDIKMISLRYFNPIGAHESGLIGEDPNDIPNNLMPFIQKVASGHQKRLMVFGDDYKTKDGTGVRDYIHVTDLALGHIAALKHQDKLKGFHVFNLGTGKGTSVLEMKDAFEKASGLKIKFEIEDRRAGDAEQVLAIPDKANKELGWKTKLTVADACRDAWKWVKLNPNGY